MWRGALVVEGPNRVGGNLLGGWQPAPARAPALPCAPPSTASLQHATSFLSYEAELREYQVVKFELSERSLTAKRLGHAAILSIHRGDVVGTDRLLQALDDLRPIRAIIGDKLWIDPVSRLRLCEFNQVAWSIEVHICCLSLLSFLRRGVLTPRVPESCLIGLSEFDDERYLLGITDAVCELEFYCVNQGQALDLRSIRLSCEAVQSWQQALQRFDFRNSDSRKRFDGVKDSVRKLEHLTYEVSLALQKQGADVAYADPAIGLRELETPGGTCAGVEAVLDVSLITGAKERYDRFITARDSVMKRSRDVVNDSKQAIHDLHRRKFPQAAANLTKSANEASAIFAAHLEEYPGLRGGSFSASLEELMKALALQAFIKHRRLPSLQELQQQSGLSFPIALQEYLGCLLDLSGEIGRLATSAVAGGRKAVPEVQLCLEYVEAIQDGMHILPYVPMGLSKRTAGLRSTATRLKEALYELALLSECKQVTAAPETSDDDVSKLYSGHPSVGHSDHELPPYPTRWLISLNGQS